MANSASLTRARALGDVIATAKAHEVIVCDIVFLFLDNRNPPQWQSWRKLL
jgi:hypothetical protein